MKQHTLYAIEQMMGNKNKNDFWERICPYFFEDTGIPLARKNCPTCRIGINESSWGKASITKK